MGTVLRVGNSAFPWSGICRKSQPECHLLNASTLRPSARHPEKPELCFLPSSRAANAISLGPLDQRKGWVGGDERHHSGGWYSVCLDAAGVA